MHPSHRPALRVCALALIAAFHANAMADKWVSVDKASGQGVFVWDNGARYTGPNVKGKREGRGTVTYPDGRKLEGIFVNNELLNGRMTSPDGSIYDGDFAKWQREGNGRQTEKDGSTFEGKFINDKPVQGTRRLANGTSFAVDMMPNVNRVNGEATLLRYDGSRTTGMLVSGVEQGQARRVSLNGDTAEGEFANANMVRGKLTWTDGAVYQGSLKAGIMDGAGVFTRPNGVRYEGGFKDGKWHGEATLRRTDGTVLAGTFFENSLVKGSVTKANGTRIEVDREMRTAKRSGSGTEVLDDGARYDGEFVNGLRHGPGVLVHADGTRREGEFRNDRLSKGTIIAPDGMRFEGSFDAQGKTDGQGVYIFPSGRRYGGGLKGGNYHGHGVLVSPDGERQEGEFIDNVMALGTVTTKEGKTLQVDQEMVAAKRSGNGTTTGTRGDRYEGAFELGKRQGLGLLTLSSGATFSGQFENDKFRRGTASYSNGDSYEGGYDDKGRYSGIGIYRHKNGEVFEGEYQEGKRVGHGVYTWPDGARFEGEYANDTRNGQGKTSLANGIQHYGSYKDGVYHGYGEMTWPDGDRYAGQFVNGKRQGKTEMDARRARERAEAEENKVDGSKLFFAVLGSAIIGSASGVDAAEKMRIAGGMVSDMYGGTNGEGIRAAAADVQANRNLQGEIARRAAEAEQRRRAEQEDQARLRAALEKQRADLERQRSAPVMLAQAGRASAGGAADGTQAAQPVPQAAPQLSAQAAAQAAQVQAQAAREAAAKRQQEQEKQKQDAEKERAARELARAAEREAERRRKEEEQQAEVKAKHDYLDAMRRSAKTVVHHCPDDEGQYYLFGLLKKPKPRVVECIDLRYAAYCPGQAVPSRGVAANFQGNDTGCFGGDAVKILPKPPCDIKQVRIEVEEIMECK